MIDGRALALIIQLCTVRLALQHFMPPEQHANNDNRPPRGGSKARQK